LALIEQIAIYMYFGIRFILQVWIPRDSITIKKCRVVLGIASLPLVSIVYLTEVINYIAIWVPGSFCCPPMPVAFFLAYVIFLVPDTLYQYYRILKVSGSTT
jgi:hypothetical protein